MFYNKRNRRLGLKNTKLRKKISLFRFAVDPSRDNLFANTPRTSFGNTVLSALDIQKLNAAYNADQCSTPSTTTTTPSSSTTPTPAIQSTTTTTFTTICTTVVTTTTTPMTTTTSDHLMTSSTTTTASTTTAMTTATSGEFWRKETCLTILLVPKMSH